MLKINGTEREFVSGMTILSLLEQMNYKVERVAVECNGEIIPRKQLAETEVKDNDVLEVVSFVGGG
ncbi:MAG: sulfur carrier protein ThiS [Blautia sp.]